MIARTQAAPSRKVWFVVFLVLGLWSLDRWIYPPIAPRAPMRAWVAQIEADLRRGDLGALVQLVQCRADAQCPEWKKNSAAQLIVQFLQFTPGLAPPIAGDDGSSVDVALDWFDANNVAICEWLRAHMEDLEYDSDTQKYSLAKLAGDS